MSERSTSKKSALPATNFTQLLSIANEFKNKCPGILLGQHGAFFLEMEMIGKLTLLSKLPANPNASAQYQLCLDIITHVDKLKSHLNKTGEDHPAEFMQLQQQPYYLHLETIKQSISTYQEKMFPNLHAARHLITSLRELKKFDPKEYGALHQLLNSLEKTFSESDLRADDKLKLMMQQISDAHDAIKRTSISPIKLFGMQATPNPLAPAMEAFMKEDMANIAKLAGIAPPGAADEQRASSSPRNSSTNP